MRLFRQTFPSPVLLLTLVITAAACTRRTGPASPLPAADPPIHPPAQAAPDTPVLARRAVDSMGGARAISRIRYIQFDFVIERNGKPVTRRSHLWDRKTGRYRLEVIENGEPITFLLNVRDKTGAAFVKQQPATPDRQPTLIQKAWDYQRMDTMWLLGGARLTDPATKLEFQGVTQVNGRYVVKVAATFGPEATPSPRDRYWLYLHPFTGQPYAWAVLQEGFNSRPETFYWARWQGLNKAAFPVEYAEIGGPRRVRINDLSSFAEVRPSVFLIP